jgi:hypothetical protein
VKIVGGDAQTGAYYKMMCDHVREVLADPGKYHPAYDPKQGIEIAGFVWFQGFNDMVRTRLPSISPPKPAPHLPPMAICSPASSAMSARNSRLRTCPFVIGVIGTGGKPEQKNPFREAMAAPAALPEFKGTVTAVHTARVFR